MMNSKGPSMEPCGIKSSETRQPAFDEIKFL